MANCYCMQLLLCIAAHFTVPGILEWADVGGGERWIIIRKWKFNVNLLKQEKRAIPLLLNYLSQPLFKDMKIGLPYSFGDSVVSKKG